MNVKVNFNGTLVEDARLSVFDHGFLFGDSVYEVVSTHRGRPCFLPEHLRRLRQSAEGIHLDLPFEDSWLKNELGRTLEAGGFPESYIRIVVTRGEGEIDIDPSSCGRPNVLIYVTAPKGYPLEYYEKGINVAMVSVKRNWRESLNPGIKTGNYLNNVLAKMEANRMGAQDAMMLNVSGCLTECTTSNLFWVREGSVFTPSLSCGILAGITRDAVIKLAGENGFPMEEGEWPAEILDKAQEVFLTGTIKKIMPVTRLDGKPVGDGRTGPVTRRLMRLYDDLLNRFYGSEPS
ncbi:MAG: branched-chain-amino acid aminotransferase [Nitrospinae bacterium CG11_big_fil_rev_8_21_14_0_20_56_8]|nr:MAG: branched-chain-amino acid aminotransferase [Nitrospinae bacterium CG11_big_fil_rev_8_21_14_0_20_56_8]